MAPRFRTLFPSLAPRWLTEGEGGKALLSLSVIMDAYAERARAGARAQLPSSAPPDALVALARDRRIVAGIAEGEDPNLASRVRRAIDDWRTAGSPFALLRQLRAYVGAHRVRTVDARGNWYAIAADGTESYALSASTWNWDGAPAERWSRFWVLIDGFFTEPGNAEYGEGPTNPSYGDGTLYGVNGTLGQVQTIRAIVHRWKPAGTRCVHIVAVLDPDLFPDGAPTDGTWGTWGKMNPDGYYVHARSETARYFEGTS